VPRVYRRLQALAFGKQRAVGPAEVMHDFGEPGPECPRAQAHVGQKLRDKARHLSCRLQATDADAVHGSSPVPPPQLSPVANSATSPTVPLNSPKSGRSALAPAQSLAMTCCDPIWRSRHFSAEVVYIKREPVE